MAVRGTLLFVLCALVCTALASSDVETASRMWRTHFKVEKPSFGGKARKLHKRSKLRYTNPVTPFAFFKEHNLIYPRGFGHYLGFGANVLRYPYGTGLNFGKKHGYGYGNPYLYDLRYKMYVFKYFEVNRWYMKRASAICFAYGCPHYRPLGKPRGVIHFPYHHTKFSNAIGSEKLRLLARVYWLRLGPLRRKFAKRFGGSAPFYNFRAVPGPLGGLQNPYGKYAAPYYAPKRFASKKVVVKKPVPPTKRPNKCRGRVRVWVNGHVRKNLWDKQGATVWLKRGDRITFEGKYRDNKKVRKVFFKVAKRLKWKETTAPFVFKGNDRMKFNYWKKPIIGKYFEVLVDFHKKDGSVCWIKVIIRLVHPKKW